jgi:hypothetical protein
MLALAIIARRITLFKARSSHFSAAFRAENDWNEREGNWPSKWD